MNFPDAIRLLRTYWRNPNMLAQELFAMFTETQAQGTLGPVTINSPAGSQPYMTLGGYQVGDTLFRIRNTDGTVTNLGLGDDGTLGPVAGTTVPKVAVASSVFAGKIVSGTGSTYQVDVFENGISRPAIRRTVKQLQINSAATIPAGTQALVVKGADGKYFMQVPVWLGS